MPNRESRFRKLDSVSSLGPAVFEWTLPKSEIHELVGRDDPLILEIGCNNGSDTLEFLAEFPGVQIHCFECDPRPIQAFRSNVADDRCELHEVAVSDRTGVATLHMSGGTCERVQDEDWDYSSSLLVPTGHLSVHPWVTFEHACQVETVRLDDWAEHVIPNRVVDFIWMDVQGAEHLVIGGGASTFARTRFCYFEYSESELYSGQQDLSALLGALGTYRLLATYQDNALAVNKAIASSRTMEWEAGREATSLALRHARRVSALHASRVLLGGHDADGRYLGGESTSVVQDLSSWLSTDGLEVAPDEEVSHFWRLATETWRMSRGLKPLSIEHPELSARLVPRNGFRPSSWGELAGSIDQIRVRQLGAMGNSVIQIMNARDLAGQFGISDLAVSDAWFLPTGRSDLHGGVRLMNLDSARAQEAGQAQAGVSVLGNFFRSSEFAPVLGVSPEEEFERLMNGLVGLADIDDLARLVNNHLDVGDPLSADHLVIHIRAGDVFRDGEVPGYGQPPLAYYLKILGSRPWAAVSVVFEDASNPVIAPLVEHGRRSPVDCDIVSGQLEHDVAFLLRARTLVAGRGTFIPAVSALSKYAEVVYCFERSLGAVGGKRLQVKPVIDVSGAYVRSVMNYNWTNSEEQRKLMLEYAVDDLAWQES